MTATFDTFDTFDHSALHHSALDRAFPTPGGEAAATSAPRPVQFVALLDGSVSATLGERRTRTGRPSVLADWHSEVRLALTHVAQRSFWSSRHDAGAPPLAAAVHFDPGQGWDLDPTPLTPAVAGRLASTIRRPAGGTRSALGYALTVAERHAARRRDLQTVVAVYSDFELFDCDLAGVLDRLGAFPGQAHAIVLGADTPDQLGSDHRVTVTEIPWNCRPGAIAQATLAALTHPL